MKQEVELLPYSLIVDKIDKDGDGFVTQDELKAWIQYTQKKYIQDDVESQWKAHIANGKTELIWSDYKKSIYGFIDGG